jgi:hypothetical protein
MSTLCSKVVVLSNDTTFESDSIVPIGVFSTTVDEVTFDDDFNPPKTELDVVRNLINNFLDLDSETQYKIIDSRKDDTLLFDIIESNSITIFSEIEDENMISIIIDEDPNTIPILYLFLFIK